jgi:hypothetical protein
VRPAAMLKIGRRLGAVAAGVVVWLAASGLTVAAERDLYSGLAYLRAGSQARAEEHLAKYRDEEGDPVIRKSVDRVLGLLKRPLAEEVREFIAATLEDSIRARPKARQDSGGRPSYWSRMFPVFP